MIRRIGPQEGPQTLFMTTPADVAIYGGAAGGGKSFALLLEPLRHIENKRFGAVIFRKTFPQIMMEGGLWDEARELYTPNPINAKERSYRMDYRFPTGAKVSFAHMETEKDRNKYDGAQIPLLCFDQLEHFSASQFWYMLARNRTTCGITPYIRATCNPWPDSWLSKLLSWWIDQETGYAITERSGIVRWFVRQNDEVIWADSELELTRKYTELIPKSFTFIAASVYDNKILLSENPEYLGNLMALDYIEEERLLRGNWKIKPQAGNLYNKDWFEIVPVAPAGGILCAFWDFAATEKKQKGKSNDPDYTARVLIRFVNGTYYVEQMTAFQDNPTNTDMKFYAVSSQDYQYAARTGARFLLRWEQEPASAGKRESARLMKELSTRLRAVDCMGVVSVGDKILRGKSFGAQAKGGNIKVVAGSWNDEWLNHMHNMPDLPHDDIHDATTGAFNQLGGTGWARGAG